MYVDGTSGAEHPIGKIHLQGPSGMLTNLRVAFQFPITNDVAKYEALMAGFKMATKAGLRRFSIQSDSQFVVEQVTRKLGCKDPTLS